MTFTEWTIEIMCMLIIVFGLLLSGAVAIGAINL